jgi:hypothetical protein
MMLGWVYQRMIWFQQGKEMYIVKTIALQVAGNNQSDYKKVWIYQRCNNKL